MTKAVIDTIITITMPFFGGFSFYVTFPMLYTYVPMYMDIFDVLLSLWLHSLEWMYFLITKKQKHIVELLLFSLFAVPLLPDSGDEPTLMWDSCILQSQQTAEPLSTKFPHITSQMLLVLWRANTASPCCIHKDNNNSLAYWGQRGRQWVKVSI